MEAVSLLPVFNTAFIYIARTTECIYILFFLLNCVTHRFKGISLGNKYWDTFAPLILYKSNNCQSYESYYQILKRPKLKQTSMKTFCETRKV